MLCPSGKDLGLPSFRKSSTDTSSSNSTRLFASSATSLDFTKDMFEPPTNNAFMEEPMSSFDWSKWEDWMQWDDDNNVAKSPVLQTASPPILPPTSDDREISNSQNSIDFRSSLGSLSMSADKTSPPVPKEIPSEYVFNQPQLTFNNELHLPVDLTVPSAGSRQPPKYFDIITRVKPFWSKQEAKVFNR
jgi:hypothetical protein